MYQVKNHEKHFDTRVKFRRCGYDDANQHRNAHCSTCTKRTKNGTHKIFTLQNRYICKQD